MASSSNNCQDIPHKKNDHKKFPLHNSAVGDKWDRKDGPHCVLCAVAGIVVAPLSFFFLRDVDDDVWISRSSSNLSFYCFFCVSIFWKSGVCESSTLNKLWTREWGRNNNKLKVHHREDLGK